MTANIIEHNYLSVALPEDWEDASQVMALGPEDSGFRPNLVFSQEPTLPGETDIAFATRQLPELRQALGDYDYVLINEGEARFGQNLGFLREHTFTFEETQLRQFQFYIIQGDRCSTFTFTHRDDRFSSVRAIAEKMFAQAWLMPHRAAAATPSFTSTPWKMPRIEADAQEDE